MIINRGEEYSYNKNYWKGLYRDKTEPFEVEYKDVVFSSDEFISLFRANGTKSIDAMRMYDIAIALKEADIVINTASANSAIKAEHKGGFDAFCKNYNIAGNTKCVKATDEELEEVKKNFTAKYGKRLPNIVNNIANVVSSYEIPKEIYVNKFDGNTRNEVRRLLDMGVNPSDITLLYCTYDASDLAKIKSLAVAELVTNLTVKGHTKGKDEFFLAAGFIINHPDTNIKMLEKIEDNAKKLHFNENTSLGNIKTQLENLDAWNEVKAIEKAYKKPGFKFDECKCTLKGVEQKAYDNKYAAYILDAKDPRQVILGEATDCCQKLGDAGETSMLHGLLNEKAGFFIIEDKNTGEIKAQAEIWEADSDTLVFDNIEFSNCDDDAFYNRVEASKEVLTNWLLNIPYKNVAMGCGYNELANMSGFDRAPNFTPTVTPREIYVMSYEEDADLPSFYERTAPNKEDVSDTSIYFELESEEKARELLESGKVNYYDYLYADVDDNKGVVWLKEDNLLSRYFGDNLRTNSEEIVEETIVPTVELNSPVVSEYISLINEVEELEEDEEMEM